MRPGKPPAPVAAPSDTGTSSIVWALTAAGDDEIRGVA